MFCFREVVLVQAHGKGGVVGLPVRVLIIRMLIIDFHNNKTTNSSNNNTTNNRNNNTNNDDNNDSIPCPSCERFKRGGGYG